MPVHEEKKPEICQICGRVFKYKLAFLKHVRTHSEFVKTEQSISEENIVIQDDTFNADVPVKVELQV